MAKDKLQDLRDKLASAAKEEVTRLNEDVAAHEKHFSALHAKKDKILSQIEDLKRQANEIMGQIRAEDYPERTRLTNELAQVARDAGSRGLGQAP